MNIFLRISYSGSDFYLYLVGIMTWLNEYYNMIQSQVFFIKGKNHKHQSQNIEKNMWYCCLDL